MKKYGQDKDEQLQRFPQINAKNNMVDGSGQDL